MITVVGIRFKDSGKTYYFDPRDFQVRQGDLVIVETVRGPEMARVVNERLLVSPEQIVGELKPILRMAEPADFERMERLYERHAEVLERCAEKIQNHNLPMKLIKAEYNFDGSRLTFYFISEKRVDFRMLVRDLARTFKSRIELRQIGPRDEARLLGGIGPCGRLLCCATFLPDYARVSIKMAKDQDLPLNPAKISGVCGRLLCCLSYEHEQYLEMRTELPPKGAWVKTPDGPGEVVAVNVLKRTVTVKLAHSGMEDMYTPELIHEATVHVHTIAHSRAQAGITPTSSTPDVDPEVQEDFDLHLDQVDNQEVLDTLAWLEESSLATDGDPQNQPPSSLWAAPTRHPHPASIISHNEMTAPEPSGAKRSRRSRKQRTTRRTARPSDEPEGTTVDGQALPAEHPQQSSPQVLDATASPATATGKRKRSRRRKKKPAVEGTES